LVESGAPISEAKVSALVEPVKEELTWWSANVKQIRNAPCRRSKPFSDAEIQKGIEDFTPVHDSKIRKDLFGLQLEDSVHLLDLLEKLLRFKPPIFANEDVGANQKTFSSDCKTVMCVVKDPKIFGAKLGPRLLFMLGRYGFNGSAYANADSDQWSPREIDDVLIGLSDYPASILPLESDRQLSHYKRGLNSKNVANAMITAFDSWDTLDQEYRQSTIVHEMGHVISMHYKLEYSSEWLRLSDWKERTTIKNGKERKQIELGRPSAVISMYGQTNPAEDFAEAVVGYRYNPHVLKAKSPEKYEFIKETVFDGLEYTSAEACNPSRTNSRQVLDRTTRAADQSLADPAATSALVQLVLKSCGKELIDQFDSQFVLTDQGLDGATTCMQGAVAATAALQDPLIQTLKFRTQAQKPTLDRLRGYRADGPGWTRLKKQTRDQLESVMLAFVTDAESLGTRIYGRNASSAQVYCDKSSKYAYQSAERVLKEELPSQDGLLFYRSREFFNGFARQVCLDLHRGQTNVTAQSSEKIAASVKKYFPNQ
ncbi:MAG TPA: hypothetical protein DCS07_18160, partial [Bdellovibrionales bacterium]|nr:hypothetical protein [Bdellovibrionales bacterium]